MKDYLVKALAFNGEVRAYSVRSTNIVREAQERHDTWSNASAALGRTLTTGAMMGAMLKGEEKLTLKIEGNGPLGHILVDSNAKGEVRGYVANPHVQTELNQFGKIDVAKAVGTVGTVSVVKDIGMKEPFTGQVPIVSGELGEDFTYYFAVSEQTPSSVGVGVLVNPDHTILASGGFIIQILPGASDECITKIENRLKTIKPVSKLIEEGLTPEEILYEVLGKEEVRILETMDVKFQCQCSRERIEGALVSIGKQELQLILEEDGEAEVKCHFCNEAYHFSDEQLKELISQM